jgi:23S rRNA pseudouridine2605 synthase
LKGRLNKFIANCGTASRRSAEKLIAEGKVAVNGRIERNPATIVDFSTDKVTVDGKIISLPEKYVYYALYKPRSYISTARDVHAPLKVTNLVPETPRVFPVGRLDKESEGLMILTNDGDLALKLTHPRYEHEKEYVVTVKNARNREHEEIRRRIMDFSRENVLPPIKVEIISADNSKAVFRIILREGKKRQIRLMCKEAGLEILKLIRVRMGNLRLGALKPGKFRQIGRDEILTKGLS